MVLTNIFRKSVRDKRHSLLWGELKPEVRLSAISSWNYWMWSYTIISKTKGEVFILSLPWNKSWELFPFFLSMFAKMIPDLQIFVGNILTCYKKKKKSKNHILWPSMVLRSLQKWFVLVSIRIWWGRIIILAMLQRRKLKCRETQ